MLAGWTEGRQEERKAGKQEGRKAGRQEGRKEARMAEAAQTIEDKHVVYLASSEKQENLPNLLKCCSVAAASDT